MTQLNVAGDGSHSAAAAESQDACFQTASLRLDLVTASQWGRGGRADPGPRLTGESAGAGWTPGSCGVRQAGGPGV